MAPIWCRPSVVRHRQQCHSEWACLDSVASPDAAVATWAMGICATVRRAACRRVASGISNLALPLISHCLFSCWTWISRILSDTIRNWTIWILEYGHMLSGCHCNTLTYVLCCSKSPMYILCLDCSVSRNWPLRMPLANDAPSIAAKTNTCFVSIFCFLGSGHSSFHKTSTYQSRIEHVGQIWCLINCPSNNVVIGHWRCIAWWVPILFSNNIQNGLLHMQQNVLNAAHITANVQQNTVKRWISDINIADSLHQIRLTSGAQDFAVAFSQFHCCTCDRRTDSISP